MVKRDMPGSEGSCPAALAYANEGMRCCQQGPSPASTTWPGHCSIQASLAVCVCASKLSFSTLLTVSLIAASHSISHRSTAPPADLGLNGLQARTTQPGSKVGPHLHQEHITEISRVGGRPARGYFEGGGSIPLTHPGLTHLAKLTFSPSSLIIAVTLPSGWNSKAVHKHTVTTQQAAHGTGSNTCCSSCADTTCPANHDCTL